MSLASSDWKLLITPLGAQSDAFEIVVSADNWLDALRAGRKQLQEDGGVPPGASCVMSATGEVTILDAANRRRYQLRRVHDEGRRRVSTRPPAASSSRPAAAIKPLAGLGTKPSEPAISRLFAPDPPSARSNPAPAPEPASSSRPAARSSSDLPAGKRPVTDAASAKPRASEPSPAATRSVASEPPSAAEPWPRASEPPPAPKPSASELPRPAATSALSEAPFAATARSFASERPRPAASKHEPIHTDDASSAEPPTEIVPEPPASSLPQKNGATKSEPVVGELRGRAQQTLAYSSERADALRREYESARAVATTPSANAPLGESGVGLPRPNLRALLSTENSTASTPPTKSTSSDRPEPRNALFPGVVDGRSERDALIRLTGRDLEPTPGSPLTYRERAYLLASPADRSRLEVLLQAELAQIRRELANKPRGQFVSLAVFDEPFQGIPTRPPLAMLEWKDWKDSAVFALTAEHGVSDPSHHGLNGAVHAPAVARPPEPPPPAPPDGPTVSTPSPRPSSLPPPAAILASLTTAPPPPAAPPAPTKSEVPELPEPPGPPISEGSGETDTRLAAAFEAMPELYFLPTPIAGLEFSIQLLLRLIPSEAISMCLYDISTDEFRFVTLTGPGAFDRRAGAVPSSAGLFGVATRGEVLLVPDAANEPRYDPQVDGRTGMSARNLAYAPVRQGGQVLGMVQLINREDERGFTQDDGAIIAYVAKQLAEFLADVRALNE